MYPHSDCIIALYMALANRGLTGMAGAAAINVPASLAGCLLETHAGSAGYW